MQPQSASPNYAVNYYTVLGLPQPRHGSPVSLSENTLKAAYHRALLQNHPDKVSQRDVYLPPSQKTQVQDAKYSIDEIMSAYQTLVDHNLRMEYDDYLLRKTTSVQTSEDNMYRKGTHLGVEVYDLEDLNYDEEHERWYRPCRCGDEEGYTVTEADLEKESKEKEIYAGCNGCSLFIKILFDLVEDNNSV